MTVSDPLDHQETSFKSVGVIAQSGLQYRPIFSKTALALSVSVVIPVKNKAAKPPYVFHTPRR